MKNIDELTKKIIAFRDARDWKQFHNPKEDNTTYTTFHLNQLHTYSSFYLALQDVGWEAIWDRIVFNPY